MNGETAEYAEIARATCGRRSRPLSDDDNGVAITNVAIAVVCVAAPLAPSRPASGPVARFVFSSFVDLRVFVVKPAFRRPLRSLRLNVDTNAA